jgi:hypothetical protein
LMRCAMGQSWLAAESRVGVRDGLGVEGRPIEFC